MLIINESCIGALLLAALYHIYLVITFTYQLFSALAEYNHKCTQPCYFPLLLKPAAQKGMMDWGSSMRSSRLRVALVAVPVVLWSLPLFRSTESRLSFKDIICVINILHTMTFGYL
jgi:hypothetical protein